MMNRAALVSPYLTTVDGAAPLSQTVPDSLLKVTSEDTPFNTLWKRVERGCLDVLADPFAPRNLMVYSQDLYRLASNRCIRVPMLTRGSSEPIQAKDDIAQQYLVLYYLLRDLFKGHLATVAPKMAEAHRKTAKRIAFEVTAYDFDAADPSGETTPEDRLALIKEHCIQWGRFAESVRKIKAIFSYVHNHWHTLDINHHKTPFDAQTMACTLWGENAMDPEAKRALGDALNEVIHRDRMRHRPSIDAEQEFSATPPEAPISREMRIVQRCLACLLELNVVHSRPLAAYADLFEKAFEDRTRSFFEVEAKKHAHLLLGNNGNRSGKSHVTNSMTLLKYLRVVDRWLTVEQTRADHCMPDSTKAIVRSVILNQFGFLPPRKDDPSHAPDRPLLSSILISSVLRCARYARLKINRTTFDIDCTRVDAETGERLFHRVDDTVAYELLERHIRQSRHDGPSLTEQQVEDIANAFSMEKSEEVVMNEVARDYECLALYCRMIASVDVAVSSFANQMSRFVQDEATNAIDAHVFGVGKDGSTAIKDLLADPAILTSSQLSIFVRYATLVEQVFQGPIASMTAALEQAMSAVLNKNSVIVAASVSGTFARTADGRACEFLARYFHSLLCTISSTRKINVLSDSEFDIKVRFSCTLLHHLQEPDHFRTHYQFLLMRRLLYSPSYAPCNLSREQLVIDRIAAARSVDFVHPFNLMLKEAPQVAGISERVSGGLVPKGMEESDASPQLSCSTGAEVVLSLLGQYGWPQSRELSEGNRDYGGGMPWVRPIPPANPNDPNANNNPHRLYPQKDAGAYPTYMVCPLENRLTGLVQANVKKIHHWSAPLSHGELLFPTQDGGKATLVVSYVQMKLLEVLESADNSPAKHAQGCTFRELLNSINGSRGGANAASTTSAQQTQEDENDVIKALFPLMMERVVEIASNPSAQTLFLTSGLSRAELTSQHFRLCLDWPQPSIASGAVVDAFCWYVLHPVSPASASAALNHFVTCSKESNTGLESVLRQELIKMTMLGGRLHVPDSGLPEFLVNILPTRLIDGTQHVVGNTFGAGVRHPQAPHPGASSNHKREQLVRGAALQATIMSLMKKHGTMTFNDIRDDTMRQISRVFAGFELDPRDFKAGLEKMITNGYIVRSSTNTAVFTYVA